MEPEILQPAPTSLESPFRSFRPTFRRRKSKPAPEQPQTMTKTPSQMSLMIEQQWLTVKSTFRTWTHSILQSLQLAYFWISMGGRVSTEKYHHVQLEDSLMDLANEIFQWSEKGHWLHVQCMFFIKPVLRFLLGRRVNG
jgi:hypothetical protein